MILSYPILCIYTDSLCLYIQELLAGGWIEVEKRLGECYEREAWHACYDDIWKEMFTGIKLNDL
jgi:hypothetical protein